MFRTRPDRAGQACPCSLITPSAIRGSEAFVNPKKLFKINFKQFLKHPKKANY